MKLIELTQGKFAKVDDHWFAYLNHFKWYFKEGYAVRKSSIKDHPEGKQTFIWMHRVINKTFEGFETDHRDGDKLNNQEENLRTATRSQNQGNRKSTKNSTSKYKGVSWENRNNKWAVQIMVNGIKKHLGRFHNEIYAAGVYDEAALKYFEEYALLNFPQEVYCEPE